MGLGVSMATIILAVFVVEIFLWLIVPVDLAGSSYPVVQHLPGVKQKFTYSVNGLGLRSLSMRGGGKGKKTIRILCLGGSNTQAPAQATEDTWHGLLEKRLQREFAGRGITIEVAAYGMGGTGILDRLKWARLNLSELSPDVVITMEGINDVTWQRRYSTPDKNAERLARLEAELASQRSLAGQLKKKLKAYSQIYRRFIKYTNDVHLKEVLAAGKGFVWQSDDLPALNAAYLRLPVTALPSEQEDPLDTFSENSKLLLGEIRSQGAEAVVLGQPVLWRADLNERECSRLWFPLETSHGRVRAPLSWLAGEMERYNEAQGGLAVEFGALYVPLGRLIPKTLDNFYDDCHYTDRGNELIAEAITPAVKGAIERVILHRGMGLRRFFPTSLGGFRE